jgi:hypothetical protein
MYPVFEKSLNSNLGPIEIASIWKTLFKILRNLLNVESAHVDGLFRNRYLVDILKLNLVKAGKRGIITRDLLSELFSILLDMNFNKTSSSLYPFYRNFFYEIILNY